MSQTLVIVESPTKAKTISKFLGKGFHVESSFGHIRDLPKSKMGIDIESGTFEPEYAVPRDKSKHVKKLKDLAKKSDEIIFATDEDREGEAISWHLAEVLGIKPEKAKRIAFHEITKTAIQHALENPRHIDQPLVDAQQARRILDRLVGYELSPFLWKKIARGLSAGRVQSVAVRLTVEREREIQAFVPQEYWSVTGLFQNEAKDFPAPISAQLATRNGEKIQKLDLKTKDEVDGILTDLESASYTILDIVEKEAKRTPPAPFITSTLQQAANNKFGYSSKQTMMIAQQLYEGLDIGTHGTVGLITYMRTDATNLSEKFLNEAKAHILESYGKEYALSQPRVYKTKSKGAQEAHEAIRPTDAAHTPESIKSFLSPQQYNVYSLIWKRAVATQMAEAKLNKTTIDIGAKQYTFRANGQTVGFDGWLRLYPESVKHEMLPTLVKDQVLLCEDLSSAQHFTQPPARYSDATLVKVMEEYGIGRPSTYAPTIATIEARNYVERDENKRLKPTDVAFVVNDLLVEHFHHVVDPYFTAEMEGNLDAIAEGKKKWQPIIAEFYKPFHAALVEKTETLAKEDVVQMHELGIDPKSGKPIYARVGRFGPFVQKGSKEDEEKPTFAKLPPGKSVETITLEEALHLLSLPRTLGQDEDGHDILANIGRFGPYVQVEKQYFSLKEDDPYTITFERALEIVKEGKEKKAKEILKKFEGSDVIVKVGRYGPYITDGKKNAKIPKDKAPEDLTLEECETLLKEAPAKGKGRRFSKKKE